MPEIYTLNMSTSQPVLLMATGAYVTLMIVFVAVITSCLLVKEKEQDMDKLD